MLFVLKTTYLIMRACANICRAVLHGLARLANIRRAVLRGLTTLAEPCYADSPTLAKGHFQEKCDLPQQIRASNAQVTQIWRKWPFLSNYFKVKVPAFLNL